MSTTKKIDVLGVYLETGKMSVRVGSLVRDTSSMIKLDVDESYIQLGPNRPILSAAFLAVGDEAKTIERLRNSNALRGGPYLPPWFSNLLPEGALRALVESGMPTKQTSDFEVLQWVGGDLPGAVVVRREDGSEPSLPAPPQIVPQGQPRIRFSLAGVQLKMSMLKKDESLTFPATGVNGNIVAKLPSSKIPHLPEVEYTSMKLAEAVGVNIPVCELIPTESVSGIPEELLATGSTVLAVNRFDRNPDGTRVHMEDFSQVLSAVGDQKYSFGNEETVMKISTLLGGGGTKPFLQAARRVAANILMGNTDAHLKNWSLRYPDPARGELSPAYDIVAFYVYDRSNEMALRFRNTRNSTIVDTARFERASEYCGVPAARVRKEIKLVVEQAADEWPRLLQDLPMPEKYHSLLLGRAQNLALSKEFGVSFESAQRFIPDKV